MPLQRWGWAAFTLSAVGFVAIAIRDGDALLLAASLAFLVGCLLFVLGGRNV